LLEQPQLRRRQQSPRLSSTRQREVPFDAHEIGGVWRDDARLIAGDITEADAPHGSDGDPLRQASHHRSRPSAQRSLGLGRLNDPGERRQAINRFGARIVLVDEAPERFEHRVHPIVEQCHFRALPLRGRLAFDD
jgi:hypothetical protein